jgi:predicted AAA+ superfamily ATPase
LGKSFDFLCEVNFEEDEMVSEVFNHSLSPEGIIEKLSAYTGVPIQAGKTLLFLDEIQACPNALRSLRFFQEKLPQLHVAAAGSLLEFALLEIPSFGVGRIQSLFMYPMSFREFLLAQGEALLLASIEDQPPFSPIPEPLFEKLAERYRTYLIIGGFPEVVSHYAAHRNINECLDILDQLIQGIRDDFAKYKKHIPQLRIDEAFTSGAIQAGRKFKYSHVNPNLPAYQVRDALNLLVLAGLVHKIPHSSAQGTPLGSQINEKKFKVIPCDVGLYQRILGGDIAELLLSPQADLINKGEAAEVATGCELLAYSSPKRKADLFYWHRESRGSNAEIDYLTERNGKVIPLEVKSGSRGKMQSLRMFMASHETPYGIRIALENAAEYDNIKVLPACALFRLSKAE